MGSGAVETLRGLLERQPCVVGRGACERQVCGCRHRRGVSWSASENRVSRSASDTDGGNGKESGVWDFYTPQGIRSHSGEYKNGKKEGKWYFYYDSGKLKVELNYINGMREGIGSAYNEAGVLVEKAEYKNDVKLKDLPTN